MKKKQLNLLAITMATIMCINAVSCGGDDEDGIIEGTYIVENGGGSNQGEISIEKLVASNVIVTSRYDNYAWTINISTTLDNLYPNKTIRYGIECGYDGNYL